MNQITIDRLFQKIGEQHITIILLQEQVAELQVKAAATAPPQMDK